MKRLLTTTFVASLSLAAAGGGRAQTRRQKTHPPPPKDIAIIAPDLVPVDQGRLEGGTYTSDFFGFSFSVKQGWVAVDAATREIMLERGRAAVEKGVSASRKAQLDAAVSRTHILINVSKYDLNISKAEFNASMLCLAERVPSAVIKTGQDYMTTSVRSINSTNAKVELTAPMRTERLGGVPFTVADIKLAAGGRVVAQRYYVRIVKGYALGFVFGYVDDEDLKAFDEMLKTVRFK